jgi:hypothetical protein
MKDLDRVMLHSHVLADAGKKLSEHVTESVFASQDVDLERIKKLLFWIQTGVTVVLDELFSEEPNIDISSSSNVKVEKGKTEPVVADEKTEVKLESKLEAKLEVKFEYEPNGLILALLQFISAKKLTFKEIKAEEISDFVVKNKLDRGLKFDEVTGQISNSLLPKEFFGPSVYKDSKLETHGYVNADPAKNFETPAVMAKVFDGVVLNKIKNKEVIVVFANANKVIGQQEKLSDLIQKAKHYLIVSEKGTPFAILSELETEIGKKE